MSKHTTFLGLAVALGIGISVLFPTSAYATIECLLTRDLTLGDTGEDIRCLQKYLNSAGFMVAENGVGSPGNETSLYREKTVDAVKRWQTAQGITPATGTFGPLSRLAYTKLLVPTPATPVVVVPTPSTPSAPTISSQEKEVRTRLASAVDAIESAEDEFQNAEDDDNETGDAEEFINDAKLSLFRALKLFLGDDFIEALDRANEARNSAKDAQDEIDGDGNSNDADEGDAQNAIDEADNDIDDAEDDIAQADDDGEDVSDAEDLIDEAKDLLNDAEDAFDDEDWDEVIDLTDEIQDLVNEALDSI